MTASAEFETLATAQRPPPTLGTNPDMDVTTTKETAIEVCRILDALTALSVDIACHDDIPAVQLVLSAEKVRDSCEAISEAVSSLKRILQITEAHGGGLIPPAVVKKLQNAQEKRN